MSFGRTLGAVKIGRSFLARQNFIILTVETKILAVEFSFLTLRLERYATLQPKPLYLAPPNSKAHIRDALSRATL